jgi:hypothetical protein
LKSQPLAELFRESEAFSAMCDGFLEPVLRPAQEAEHRMGTLQGAEAAGFRGETHRFRGLAFGVVQFAQADEIDGAVAGQAPRGPGEVAELECDLGGAPPVLDRRGETSGPRFRQAQDVERLDLH